MALSRAHGHPRRTLPLALIAAVDRRGGIGLQGQLPWMVCSPLDLGGASAESSLKPLNEPFGSLRADMRRFREVTTGTEKGTPVHQFDMTSRRVNAVIMGRTTFESIPETHRPLRGRLNVVLTRRLAPSRSFAGSKREEGTRVCGTKVMPSPSNQFGDSDVSVEALCKRVLIANGLEDALDFLEAYREVLERVFVIGGVTVFEESMSHVQLQELYLTEIDAEFGCDRFFPSIPADAFDASETGEWCEERGLGYRFMKYSRSLGKNS